MGLEQDALNAYDYELYRQREAEAVAADRRAEKVRDAFERTFGLKADAVDGENGTATREGTTLFYRLDPYTRMAEWRAVWRCPECGQKRDSEAFFDLVGLGRVLREWDPVSEHECMPDEDEEPEPAVQELVSADSRLAAVIREMIDEALTARAGDGAY